MAETAAAVLWEIGAAWATEAAIYIAANAAYINAAAAFVASSAYGGYQKRKAAANARDAYNASLEDRLVMTSTAQGARSRVYGRVRNVDGIVFKATHGANSEFYTMVIALAGHEVDAIETIYFDDVAVSLDGSGYVQTAPWYVASLDSHSTDIGPGTASVNLGMVPAGGATMVWEGSEVLGIAAGQLSSVSTVGTTVTFAGGAPASGAKVVWQTNNGASKARVRSYTGAAGQNLYSVLQPLVGSVVQSTDRFEGIACLVVTFEFDTDAFPSGLPQVSAVMRGAKVIDPRGGTAWSQNPAAIAYDWSLYSNGGGCSSGEIKTAAFVAAANACDVSTGFVTTTGTETRPLYQCGIAIPLDGNPDEALSEIVESMAGQWGWAGGQLTVRAGAYRAPVTTITEDWITDVSAINVVDTSTADLVNVMRPTLSDAANNYTPAAAADVRAAAYISADGRELPRELTLGGVTRAVHAQHVCGVLMRETREGLTVTLPCNFRAYALELFDVVTLVLPVFGWGAGKLFEVTGWEFSLTGAIQLTLRETSAAIYTPDSSFDVLTTSPNTALPNPAAVEGMGPLTVTSNVSALADSSIVTRTVVAWTPAVSQAVRQSGSVEVQYHDTTTTMPAGDWTAMAPVGGGASSTTHAGLRASTYYLLRARFINSLGVRGKWGPQAVHRVIGPRTGQVYRQGTAPTGVQDGDTWQDTSTGRQYERVAGAWQAVVGAGSVGTGQLVDNAAADVQESFSAGPVSLTGSGNIKTLSVTNLDTSPRKVIVHCTISYVGTAGGSGAQSWLLVSDGSSPVYVATLQAAAGATLSDGSSFSVTFILPAGATSLYHIAHQTISGSWASMAFNGITQRTELIYK